MTVILEQNKAILNEIKSIIWKFVHASYTVLLLRHILHNLHFKLKLLKKKNYHWSKILSKKEISKLILWKKILKKTHKEVSLKSLDFFFIPTSIGFLDSCP